jgi:predicted dehydrogenase
MILPSGLVRGYAANERVAVACVGVGGQGQVNRREIRDSGVADVVAICDVDEKMLASAADEHAGAIQAIDFRELLEKHGKTIDAVVVSTPDHLHAPVSMMAMRMGKHVDCEKPLTHSVFEARAMAEAAKKYKVATQLDNEGHSSARLRTAVEWARAGAVGDITKVDVWTDRPIWPQALAKRPPAEKVPSQLHWDLWLGPAPEREYHDLLHPFKWRGWWDFGTGALGDIGCHSLDGPFWALELGAPESVDAEHEGNTPETFPKWSIVTYQFPERTSESGKTLPPVTLKWYDGGKRPPRPAELPAGEELGTNGVLLHGSKGIMFVGGLATGATPRLLPVSLKKDFTPPPPTLSRPKSHKHDWLAAIRGGPAAGSDFANFGGPLAETVLLGNVAIRAGRGFKWDAKALRTDSPETDRYLRRDYRKGWEL